MNQALKSANWSGILGDWRNRGPTMITISCPDCSKRLKAPDNAVGKPVQCVCGKRFVCPAVPAIVLSPLEAGFEDEPNRLRRLQKPRRHGLETPVVIAIVLGVAVVSGVVVWATMSHANGKGVAGETTAATIVPNGGVNVAPAGNVVLSSPSTATTTARGARTAQDAKKELLAAEETLASLSKTYARNRTYLVSKSIDSMTPDEFRPLMSDMDSGKPVEVVLENESRRNEEKDRGLSPEDRLASINARTQRKKQFLDELENVKREFENPKSRLSLALERGLDELDSTKELRKQESLVARLREEVQALKSTGK
jgi:hypothetical protein